jgi:hypothetical protein
MLLQAEFAISEEEIISSESTCSSPGTDAMDQIRSDFTICALPADSLSGNCIDAALNEPDSCGFSGNVVGLCMYCGKSSPNATDTCCYNADLSSCKGVTLPSISSLAPLFPSSTSSSAPGSSATASSTAVPASSGHGLSGGKIAGIVVGAVVGGLLLIALVALLCISLARRRRHGSQNGSIFNQPSPQRKPGMKFNPQAGGAGAGAGYTGNQPAGRVARMAALEGSGSSRHTNGTLAGAAAIGAGAGAIAGGRRHADLSSSEFGDSPESRNTAASANGGRMIPSGRRGGSLSSASALAAGAIPSSPVTDSSGQMSPGGVASQQSEQLASFKDYYSQDDIRTNDKVACLWAYQPRAADEFELERGDMLRVIGIWDDGWATGVRLDERAEDYESKRKVQRDSGLSDGGNQEARTDSPPPAGDIKAFPLVCVCLPEHWKKTIEGDSSTEAGSSATGPPPITQ